MLFILMLYCLYLFRTGEAVHLPPSIKSCSRSDPNFLECVKNSIETGFRVMANGSKELGIPVLEPLYIPKFNVDGSRKNGPVSLEFNYENIYLSGLTNIHVSDISIEFDNGCKLLFHAKYPKTVANADFTIKGKLMIFSLNFKGKGVTTYNNVHANNSITCEKYKKQGQVHLRITNYTMDMLPENAHFDFVPDSTENQEVYNQILRTANENYDVLYDEHKEPNEELFSQIYKKYINSVFSKIPMNELFLE